MLVADGFGIAAVLDVADLLIEPAAGIFPARFPGKRESPLAGALLEKSCIEPRQITNFADAAFVQVALGDLADPRNLAHIERSEEPRLLTMRDPQNAVRLGLIGSDFRDQARLGRADGAVEIGRAPHRGVERV